MVDLDLLSEDEAVALLRTRIPGIDSSVAGRIVELLGHLPLAVEQATAYLERTGMDPSAYADLLQTRLGDMLERGADPSAVRRTIGTLWQLSLDRLAEANPAAVQLIEICAQLAPEPIPLDLFTGHASELPEPLARRGRRPSDLRRDGRGVERLLIAAPSHGREHHLSSAPPGGRPTKRAHRRNLDSDHGDSTARGGGT